MESRPGTYALVLRSHGTQRVEVGRWGILQVERGYYVYVGSAFGPGGVRARVLRHCREAKARHWHIDYLREVTRPILAWCSYAPVRLEHRWAQTIGRMPEVLPIAGFGCSDCACLSHLFYMAVEPDGVRIARALGKSVETWRCQRHGRSAVAGLAPSGGLAQATGSARGR